MIDNDQDQKKAVQRALKRIIDQVKKKNPGRKGGMTLIADRFEVKPQTVQAWYARGSVPPYYVEELAELGDHVSQTWELCPKAFRPPQR